MMFVVTKSCFVSVYGTCPFPKRLSCTPATTQAAAAIPAVIQYTSTFFFVSFCFYNYLIFLDHNISLINFRLQCLLHQLFKSLICQFLSPPIPVLKLICLSDSVFTVLTGTFIHVAISSIVSPAL